jgi:hypothetical protein
MVGGSFSATAAAALAQLLRHLHAVDTGNQVLGGERGHVRAGVDGSGPDVRQQDAVGKPLRNFN